MNLSIAKAEDEVRSFEREHHNGLSMVGYVHITATKPHIPINYILRKLKTSQLFRRMLDTIGWKMDESFHKDNFDCFVCKNAFQEEKIQAEQRVIYEKQQYRNKEHQYEIKNELRVA